MPAVFPAVVAVVRRVCIGFVLGADGFLMRVWLTLLLSRLIGLATSYVWRHPFFGGDFGSSGGTEGDGAMLMGMCVIHKLKHS